jgi:hypothetical protein
VWDLGLQSEEPSAANMEAAKMVTQADCELTLNVEWMLAGPKCCRR